MVKDSVAHIFADLADEREEGLLDAEPRFGGGLQVRKSQFVGCRCRCREQTSERESNNYEHSSRVEKCAYALRITEPTYEIRVRVAAMLTRVEIFKGYRENFVRV